MIKKNSLLANAAFATLALGALVLTGCTNASQTGGSADTSSDASADSTEELTVYDVSGIEADPELAAMLPARITDRGTLISCTTASYAPGEFLAGPDGRTPVGYDVDIAAAIAAKFGVDSDLQSIDFATILPSLGTKCDLGTAGHTITDERKETVDFVSYLKVGTLWAVQAGNPKDFSLDDVCGRAVGVQTGTFQETDDLIKRSETCEAEGKDGIEIVSLKTFAEVTTRLVNGSIDAMLADSPVTGYAVAQTSGALELSGEPYSQATAGIAVAKVDQDLSKATQEALNQLIADGSYAEILDRWGVDSIAIETAEFNPAVEN